MLWLNADETSVAFQFEPRSGNRVRPPPSRRLGEYVERTSLAERRCRATLIASIVASTLPLPVEPPPQVFLVARAAAARFVPAPLPANTPSWMHVWEHDNAWVNNDLWVRWIRLVHDWRRVHAPHMRLIIVVDALRAHHCAAALILMEELGMELLVLPALLTWLLQMLDTHGFAVLKQILHEGLLRARTEAHGNLTAAAWWAALLDAVDRALLHRDWMPVFKGNGLGGTGADLRPKLFQLGLGPVADVPLAVRLEDITECLPARSDHTKVRIMWRYAQRARLPDVIALPPPPPLAPALPPPRAPDSIAARVAARRRAAPY